MAEGEEAATWAWLDAAVVTIAFILVGALTFYLMPSRAPKFTDPGVMATLVDNRVLIGVLRATGVIVVIYATVSVALLLKDKVLITKAGGVEVGPITQAVQDTKVVLDDKDHTIESLVAENAELRKKLGEQPAVPLSETVEDAQQKSRDTVVRLNQTISRLLATTTGQKPTHLDVMLLYRLRRLLSEADHHDPAPRIHLIPTEPGESSHDS